MTVVPLLICGPRLNLFRKQSSKEVQHSPIDNDDKIPVSRDVSETAAPCTCGVRPIKRMVTTATTDSAKTLRESLSSPSPSAFGYDPFRKRTLSSTGSTAQESPERLNHTSRSYSASTARTSSGSSAIRECSIAPSFGYSLNKYQFCQRETPEFLTNGLSKPRLKNHWYFCRREKSTMSSRMSKMFSGGALTLSTLLLQWKSGFGWRTGGW